jgi:hypothetical protein
MAIAGETISRYADPLGQMHYSVRRRHDGFFQIVHDGTTLEDGSQPDWMEDRVLSGIYGTAELAEAELIRITRGKWSREY